MPRYEKIILFENLYFTVYFKLFMQNTIIHKQITEKTMTSFVNFF